MNKWSCYYYWWNNSTIILTIHGKYQHYFLNQHKLTTKTCGFYNKHQINLEWLKGMLNINSVLESFPKRLIYFHDFWGNKGVSQYKFIFCCFKYIIALIHFEIIPFQTFKTVTFAVYITTVKKLCIELYTHQNLKSNYTCQQFDWETDMQYSARLVITQWLSCEWGHRQ